jgi:antitoxin VapB
MHVTRLFRDGEAQAVHIPAELAYGSTDIEMEIERVGDEIRLRPRRPSLAGVLERFARLDARFMAEGRGDHEQAERDGL